MEDDNLWMSGMLQATVCGLRVDPWWVWPDNSSDQYPAKASSFVP